MIEHERAQVVLNFDELLKQSNGKIEYFILLLHCIDMEWVIKCLRGQYLPSVEVHDIYL